MPTSGPRLYSAAFLFFATVLDHTQLVNATRDCPSCIPLELLTAPAYGISISNHGLSLAIEYHNGTLQQCGTIAPSTEYLALLQQWHSESLNLSHFDPPYLPAVLQYDLTRPTSNLISRLRQWILPTPAPPEPPPPPTLTPAATILKSALLSLIAASETSPHYCPPPHYTGFSIPPFFTAVHTSHLFTAAASLGLISTDLSSTPAAAVAAAHNINLCRIPSEYLPCTPEGIMTLDLSSAALSTTWLRIGDPHLGDTAWNVNRSLGATAASMREHDTTAWINEFTAGKLVSKLFLVGREASERPEFLEAVRASEVGKLLVEAGEVHAEWAEAIGVAKMTKERMESQRSDCIEDEACENVWDEADRIAGTPAWKKPKETVKSEL